MRVAHAAGRELGVRDHYGEGEFFELSHRVDVICAICVGRAGEAPLSAEISINQRRPWRLELAAGEWRTLPSALHG